MVGFACLAACERAPSPAARGNQSGARDTAPAVVAATPTATPPAPAWNPAGGAALLVRGANPETAWIVLPQYVDSALPDTVRFDLAALRGARVQLVGRDGSTDSARIDPTSARPWLADQCIEWPQAAVHEESAVPRDWAVAFVHGSVTPISLDSIEGLAQTDSAELAATIARLASALSDDTSRTFLSIPYSVRTAYRFSAAPGVQAVVTDVVQRLNQEANPLEQHTLMIAEKDSAAPNEAYRVVYHERTRGSEEKLRTSDVLAAVGYPPPDGAALVLLREGPESSAYALLVRGGGGRWRVRWTSVYTGC